MISEIRRIEQWEKTETNAKKPRDDFERVKRHYSGWRIWWDGKIKIGISKQFFAALVFPITYIMSMRTLSRKINKKDIIIYSPNKDYLLKKSDVPEELLKRYSRVEWIINNKRSLYREIGSCRLDKTGRKIILELIRRYPFSPFMNLSVMLHLSKMSRFVREYQCKAIVTTQTEQDFSSSLITQYCEMNNIKYICVQHGEYCYNPSMAYVRFSEYYAWNCETVDILELTNTKMQNVHIYTPSRMLPTCKKRDNPEFFMTYYFSAENKDEINCIKNILVKFSNAGFRCCVRPHPRHTDMDALRDAFKDTSVIIENYKEVSIDDSLCNTHYIVSFRSTVLTQGFINSMPIVIDDLVGDIKILEITHDINITRANMRLSELVKKYLPNIDLNE